MIRRPRTLPAALALIAALVVTSAHAGVTPQAARVVKRYLEAVGGPADTVRTLYTKALVTGFGFKGLNESWAVRPDRHFSRTMLGPFELREGFNGRAAWRTDPTTSKIVSQIGAELDDARSDAWFEWERWSEPGGAGGDVSVQETRRDSSGSYTVLLAKPPVGRERRLWFDDATGLQVRAEAPNDQQTIVSENTDWRPAAGRLRPFRNVTRVEGMVLNQLVAEVEEIRANAPMAGVPFSIPDSVVTLPVTWLGQPGAARLPFEYAARHLWVRASVDGGPPQDFLLDTGATVSVLDSTWAAANGLAAEGRMQASGAGAAGGASFARVRHLRVQGVGDGSDGVDLSDLKVAVMSVNPMFEPYFWKPLAGIIGYDVLSRFVTTIDYDRRVVELHDPATFRAEGRGAPLTMVLNGAIPAVDAVIDGHAGLFRLDIGSSSTVDLHGPFVQRFGLAKKLRHPLTAAGAGFGGTFESRLGRLGRMSIGPHTWRDPIVSLSLATEGAFASRDYAGNIGNHLLERFRVTLDYEGRRLWLEPGARSGVRDSLSRSGMLVGRVEDRWEVMSTLPGSPADQAGIGAEDELVSVDGRPMAEWTHAALEDLLDHGRVGRVVPVVLRGADGPRTVKLVLREVLP